MSVPKRGVIAAAFTLVLLPAALAAQAPAAPAPEVRYLTVTRFRVPQSTEEREKVMMWIDSVLVPQARMDPSVVSFHAATHNWGANSNDVVLISEYRTWADVNATCAACNEWFEQKQPREGTPERARWDDMATTFARANGGHSDEIYAIPVTRSKR